MTKDEFLEFVRRENERLEMSWNIDRPPCRFGYDSEADIGLLNIYDKWMKLRKTHAMDYHITEERFWSKTHKAVDIFMAVYPNWTDVKHYPDGSISWGSSW